MSAVALNISCTGCNASFSIDRVAAHVHCPFCGQHQVLAGHEDLRHYEQEVGRRVNAADEQRQIAAALDAWTASAASSPARNLAMAYGLIIGVPIVLAILLTGINALGLLPMQDSPLPALAIGGTSYLGVALYFVWYFANRARARESSTALENVQVACPTCGAPSMLTPGASIDTCDYCGGALIPSPTLIEQGVGAAKAAQRQAALDRRRASREASARAQDLGAFALFMPVMMIGSFVLMLGGAAIGFSYGMIRGTEPYSPAIFILWAMTLALVGGVVMYWSRRKDRRNELHATLAHASQQLNGQLLPTIDARVSWLNAWWTEDYNALYLHQGYVSAAAAVEIEGYRALIDFDLQAQPTPPRLDLLLAAWIPGISDGANPGGRLRNKALTSLGFYVRKTSAGLTAHASPQLLAACRASPQAAHVAVPALVQLARAARALGAEPV